MENSTFDNISSVRNFSILSIRFDFSYFLRFNENWKFTHEKRKSYQSKIYASSSISFLNTIIFDPQWIEYWCPISEVSEEGHQAIYDNTTQGRKRKKRGKIRREIFVYFSSFFAILSLGAFSNSQFTYFSTFTFRKFWFWSSFWYFVKIDSPEKSSHSTVKGWKRRRRRRSILNINNHHHHQSKELNKILTFFLLCFTLTKTRPQFRDNKKTERAKMKMNMEKFFRKKKKTFDQNALTLTLRSIDPFHILIELRTHPHPSCWWFLRA